MRRLRIVTSLLLLLLDASGVGGRRGSSIKIVNSILGQWAVIFQCLSVLESFRGLYTYHAYQCVMVRKYGLVCTLAGDLEP